MRDNVLVTHVSFSASDTQDRATGLLGYVEFIVDHWLHVAGVTVRRTREGRLMLSYPARRDRFGNQYHFLRIPDLHARLDIERQVLAAIGMEGSP